MAKSFGYFAENGDRGWLNIENDLSITELRDVLEKDIVEDYFLSVAPQALSYSVAIIDFRAREHIIYEFTREIRTDCCFY